MISYDQTIIINSILVDKFGGADEILDEKSLISAMSRPYQTFDN